MTCGDHQSHQILTVLRLMGDAPKSGFGAFSFPFQYLQHINLEFYLESFSDSKNAVNDRPLAITAFDIFLHFHFATFLTLNHTFCVACVRT
jgi:hypothetical protein